MEKTEIRKMTDGVLTEELKKLREQNYNLRTQTVTEKVADTTAFGRTRRDIARVMTEMRSREIKKAKA